MSDEEQSDFSSDDDEKSTPIITTTHKKKCPVCKKEIVVKHMKDHIRTHTGARPYECKDCGKTFIQSSHLKVHMQNIHNATLMMCDHCQKVLRCKSTLINHMKTHLADRKMYHCSVCNKGLASHNAKEQHERIHTGEKPVHCDQCSERFRTKDQLIVHFSNHHQNGTQMHTCKICNKGFNTRKYYNTHMRVIHNNDRPSIRCPICSQVFISKQGINLHLKGRHNSSLKESSLRERDLSCSLDDLVEPSQMKEFSIFIRRSAYIEKAVMGGYKSILIYSKVSGRHPLPLK